MPRFLYVYHADAPIDMSPEDAAVAGMKLADLDDDARRRLNLDKAEGGVLIADVAEASHAARLGLAPGDAILAVAGTPVSSARAVRRARRAPPGA